MPAKVVPQTQKKSNKWLGMSGPAFDQPMVAGPLGSADAIYYKPYHGMGQETPSMVDEFGPQSGKVFENLSVLLEDPTAQREAMRQQTAAQAGQAMAGLQVRAEAKPANSWSA